MKHPLLLAFCTILSATPALAVPDSDRELANSYDDAWQSGVDGWVAHLKAIRANAPGKTDGFVLHIGDSISYSAAYTRLAQQYAGANAADAETIAWSTGGGSFFSTAPDNTNGWRLANYDHPEGGRSFTASSGITTQQWLTGGSHGMAAGAGDSTPLDTLLDNTSTAPYAGPGFTVAVVQTAQVAVVMLGTNDIAGGDSIASIRDRLQTVLEKLESRGILPILSTVPPRRGMPRAEALNTEIASLAEALRLPLIDFHSEILRRRPGTTWDGTLISADGIHPTALSYADPDANGGAALSDDGYLLRAFLTVQKLREVRSAVLTDAPEPPDAGSDADGGADGGLNPPVGTAGCSCSSPGGAFIPAWLALLFVAILRRRREGVSWVRCFPGPRSESSGSSPRSSSSTS